MAKCGRSLRRKTLPNQRFPLISITTNQPIKLLLLDFLKVEPSKGGFETSWLHSMAFPCRNQRAATTANTLDLKVFIHYSFPSYLHSDQGRHFEIPTISTYVALLTSRNAALHHIMQWAMDSANTLIGPYWIWWGYWHQQINWTGSSTSHILRTHVIAPNMTQQATILSI